MSDKPLVRLRLVRRAAACATLSALLVPGGFLLSGGLAQGAGGAPAPSLVQQAGELTAAGGSGTGTDGEDSAGALGASVALSADGSTALLGAPNEDGTGGAAYVFTHTGGAWAQQQGGKLTASEAEGAGGAGCGVGSEGEEEEEACGFGKSVALSADGNTAIVGAPQEAGACSSIAQCAGQGAAWVYVRSEGRWHLQAKLTGGSEETVSARFGRSVALSADGNTAIVGAPLDSNVTGAAWVFTRSGETWSRQGPKLAVGSGGETRFGVSVALSADGDTALIGGPGEAGARGAAWIFARSGSSWLPASGKLTGGEEQGEGRFGFSVALSGDGSTALIGGRSDGEGSSSGAGAAWVFARTASAWAQQGGKLTGPPGLEPPSAFGYSVALSSDGNEALVGAPRNDVGRGAAWLFIRSGASWSAAGEKLIGLATPGEAQRPGRFGNSVALRADGATAVIGAPTDSGGTGAAWSFADSSTIPSVASVTPSAGPSAGGTTVTIAGDRLASATAIEFVSAACAKRSEEGCSAPAVSFSVNPSGSITAVTPPAPRPIGLSYVVVTTPDGVSALGSASQYTYAQPPAVSGLSPTQGPTGGGTAVTVDGSHLGGASAVYFGAVPARNFTVSSDGSLTAVSPAEPVSTVSVTVITPGGASRETSRSRFTFIAAGPSVVAAPAAAGQGAAALGVLPFAAGCRAQLASRTLTVLSRARASVRLIWRGAATCRGKLRLNARVRIGRRLKSKTIAVGTFAIAAGKVRIVTLKLNKTGRYLLRAGHGRLRATLLVASLAPPTRGVLNSVRLLPAPRPASKPRKR